MHQRAAPQTRGPGPSLAATWLALRHRPLVLAAAAFALGIHCGGWPWSLPVLLGLGAGAAVTGLQIGRRLGGGAQRAQHRAGSLPMVGIWFAFAASRAVRQQVQNSAGPYDIARFASAGYVRVEAEVASEPEVRHGITFIARPLSVRLPSGAVHLCRGLLSCRVAIAPGRPVPRYGDSIRISGDIEATAQQSRGTRAALRRHGVFSAMEVHYPSLWSIEPRPARAGLVRFALNWRNSMLAVFRRYLPQDRASLATGIALGGVQGMTEEQADAFRMSGLLHILAASGANVAILVGPLWWLLRRLYIGRPIAAAACMAAIALYALAAGAQPSVTRAAIMATVYLAAPLFDRDHDSTTALAAAALATLAWDPGNLQDVGFLLSFTIVAALIAYWPTCARGIGLVLPALSPRSAPLSVRLVRNALRGIAATIAITAIAGLAAAPLTAQVFNSVPTLGIPANAATAPALVVLLPASLLAWAASLLSPSLCAFLCHTVVGPLTGYIGSVAHLFAGWPGAVVNLPSPGWAAVAVCYACLGAGAAAVAGEPSQR